MSLNALGSQGKFWTMSGSYHSTSCMLPRRDESSLRRLAICIIFSTVSKGATSHIQEPADCSSLSQCFPLPTPPSFTGANPAAQAGAAAAPRQGGATIRDPRRNGLDGGQPEPAATRPVILSWDMLRFSSLVVAQIANSSVRHVQANALPGLARAVNALHLAALGDRADNVFIQVSLLPLTQLHGSVTPFSEYCLPKPSCRSPIIDVSCLRKLLIHVCHKQQGEL